MLTVLVTGAGGGVGQGIIKALRLMDDIEVRIVAADMSPWAAGLYAADVATLVPRASDPGYAEAVVALCRRERIDYYLPGTDVELGVCAEHAARIQADSGAKVVVARPEVITIADDKHKTARFLAERDFPYPKTFLREEWRQAALPLPLVVKPRVGCRSIGVEVIRTEEDLGRALGREDIVLQEYLGGEDSEYTCTIVFQGGKPSDVIVLQRWLRDGDTYRVVPVRDREIEDYVRAVATALDVDGSCNFQLRKHQGTPVLFEINARFSGTTPLCAELGFNPVASYLLRDRGIDYAPRWRTDAIVLRHWAELVVDRAAFDQLALERRIVPSGVKRNSL
jgi:carbamoyl-phosphate synthase large subunit